jgi:3-oxoacyl-[acyl-carrier protein] reductase
LHSAAIIIRYLTMMLTDKVAVVTGGSRGIGLETARRLTGHGARVAVMARRVEAVDSALAIAGDATSLEDLERVRERVEAELGPVDVVAAFAGSGQARPGPVWELSDDDWRSTVDGHLTATFLTFKAFLLGMVERGRGAIVTMASAAGRTPTPAAPAPYAAAKAGIVALTRHVAAQVGPSGVRVNCISPSTVLTERTAQVMPDDVRRRFTEQHPLGRLGEPSDVAEAACFLASDRAAWLTGVVLDVAGGAVMV